MTRRETASPPCAPGDLLELTPHDLSPDGGVVAGLNGFVVFLDRGLPGERVRARVRSVKRRFARAEVTEISAPAGAAAPAYCPHLGECGGCAWPGLDYTRELAWKERQVREVFRRIGRLPTHDEAGVLFQPILPSPLTLGYRNKLEFAFASDNGKTLIGLRRRGSHRIIPVGDCALARSSVKGLLSFTRRWTAERKPAENFLRRLTVRMPDYAPQGQTQFHVELAAGPPGTRGLPPDLGKDFGAALMRTMPEVTGFVYSLHAENSHAAYNGKILHALGSTAVYERLGHVLLEAPAAAFLQVNTKAAALMHAEVRRLAEPSLRRAEARIWDLYCGVGGIGIFTAGADTRLRGFESSREAVACATRNAARNGLNFGLFTTGDVARRAAKAARLEKAADIVITDPPRAGISRELCALLLRLRPRIIIAVSCDPASQARDLSRLAGVYRLREVRPLDFFPHTPHVETVALLEREERLNRGKRET